LAGAAASVLAADLLVTPLVAADDIVSITLNSGLLVMALVSADHALLALNAAWLSDAMVIDAGLVARACIHYHARPCQQEAGTRKRAR
jgi:hypothetical protein